jgi:hypothetical protein
MIADHAVAGRAVAAHFGRQQAAAVDGELLVVGRGKYDTGARPESARTARTPG